ncbi:hypothetical protein [Methylobacterium iners]|uniref:Uncharacterized protein n=1 Tax=Methylobacterium iners TaxID=418707 RepID=A0ABQ4RRY8_9HYPH|nr:hypothetical protein [Methylobacterium iners]GJD92947.1 hypothetical protein OCOJLMKI_0130 [Methylobacterium iners]
MTSDGPAVVDPLAPSHRITLPAPPEGVAECLRQAFPEIPDRALTKGDVVRIIGAAKVLDRSKTACGARAVTWIEAVRRELAR